MKAIVFTMDAVFALLITLIGISILLFFNFFSQTSYSIKYSNAQALFKNLAATPVESLQNSNIFAKLMAAQFQGANETWPQFGGGPAGNSSTAIGPLDPILAFTYNPNNIITAGIVADYGNIYFAANYIVYAVNASTNRNAWTRNVISNVLWTPALYNGMLFFANSTNLTAVSAKTGNIIWTTNSIRTITPITTPISVYDNQVVFGASDSNVHSYAANNGTALWANYVSTTPDSIMNLKGTLVMENAANLVATIVSSEGSANQLVTTTYAAGNPPTNNIAGSGTRLYFGTASSANSVYINGTVATGFPVALGSSVTGVAVYSNYVVYQTASGINALSTSGSSYWSVNAPASFGTPIANATPVIAGPMVYTAWSNGLAGVNLTTGAIKWFALMPSAKISPHMAVAYGRLYAVVNNNVWVYGSCNVPLRATLLTAAATTYWNSEAGCGSALLNSVYPMANYSFYVGNALPHTASFANFNGVNGYISAHNTGALNTSYVSASFWLNVSATPTNGVKIVNYGDSSGCAGTVAACGWYFYLTPTNVLQFTILNGQAVTANSLAISNKKWYFVTGSFNGTYVSLYLNSNAPFTTNTPITKYPTAPNINLTIGTGRPCCDVGNFLSGNVANLQIYSKPLGRYQIAQLYGEGATGPPVANFGLVAWYPLQGDANDYALFNPGYLAGSAKFLTGNYVGTALGNSYSISQSSAIIPVANYSKGVTNAVEAGIYSWG